MPSQVLKHFMRSWRKSDKKIFCAKATVGIFAKKRDAIIIFCFQRLEILVAEAFRVQRDAKIYTQNKIGSKDM